MSLRLRRALLYMPGDSRRKIEKALTLGVDSICMDLEDGVAVSQKAEARITIRQALAELNFGRSEKLVRINAAGTGWEAEDLTATLGGRPDGVVLPKVEGPEAVAWLDAQLTAAEAANAWPARDIGLIAMIETARGVVNLKAICEASPRLQALIFGAEDLASDIGATRTAEASEVFYARSAVVMHAAAYGLQAIDMVYVNYADADGLSQEATAAARMGYSGKQAIHPKQVEVIQAAFAPAPEAVAKARRVLEAAAAAQAEGLGAFALDGKMVDAPVIKAAENVMAKARAAEMEGIAD